MHLGLAIDYVYPIDVAVRFPLCSLQTARLVPEYTCTRVCGRMHLPITSINYRSSPLTTVTVASYPRPSSLFYNGKDKLYNGEASPLGLGTRLL